MSLVCYGELKVEKETTQQQIVGDMKNEHSNALKEEMRLCKKIRFTGGLPISSQFKGIKK